MVKLKFIKYGDTFECILSGVIHSIYKRTTPYGRVSYEVIRPVVVSGDLIYPSSSFWGTYGWTVNDYDDAIKKMVDKDKEFVNKDGRICSDHENAQL